MRWIIWRRVREELQVLRPAHEALDTSRLNLILSTPVIPKENILLIEGIHDLLAQAQPIEELWKKWQQPEIWRLPHGHVSAQCVLGLMGRVLRWLAPRLDKPLSPDRGDGISPSRHDRGEEPSFSHYPRLRLHGCR